MIFLGIQIDSTSSMFPFLFLIFGLNQVFKWISGYDCLEANSKTVFNNCFEAI
jgi:predicted RND superfamily exporter protein